VGGVAGAQKNTRYSQRESVGRVRNKRLKTGLEMGEGGEKRETGDWGGKKVEFQGYNLKGRGDSFGRRRGTFVLRKELG